MDLKKFKERDRVVQTTTTEIFKRNTKQARSCLNQCTYVTYGWSRGIKFFPAVTDPSASRIHALPTEPGYVSWFFNSTLGRCTPVFDGSGEYTTDTACLMDNTQGVPTYFSVSDTAFSQPNFYSQDNNFTTQSLSAPGDDENDINSSVGVNVRLSGILPYERDAGGGEFEIVVESGVVPGNIFNLQATIETNGTTSPSEIGTPTFDADRYCWVLWEDSDNPGTYEFVEFFLSTEVADLSNTLESGGAPSSTWVSEGGGVYRYTWFNTDYATVIATTDKTLSFNTTTEARTPPTIPGNWEFVKSQTSLEMDGRLYRDTFIRAFSSNRWDALFARSLDPLTYMQQAGPIFRNNDQYFTAFGITEAFYVDTGDGKIYFYWKYGKVRNPAIDYLDREWLIVERHTLDYTVSDILTTNKAGLTVEQFINPAPIPDLIGNALSDRTDTYLPNPAFSDPCVEQIDNIQNEEIKFTLCQLDLDGMTTEKRDFKETHIQQDCLNRIKVYRLKGFVVPSTATCQFPT